jgi:hypothetical protein
METIIDNYKEIEAFVEALYAKTELVFVNNGNVDMEEVEEFGFDVLEAWLDAKDIDLGNDNNVFEFVDNIFMIQDFDISDLSGDELKDSIVEYGCECIVEAIKNDYII